ncbi:uncharacterized protein M6B38_390210 [Iris pallida]|uniref:Uncharacterized protein n=1 Tax=Iris pallida TaxID=29817 RepID=A0AAX6G065_IRIPA|nr:uncharacterized protein M6B38_390210 [Iris pallida]
MEVSSRVAVPGIERTGGDGDPSGGEGNGLPEVQTSRRRKGPHVSGGSKGGTTWARRICFMWCWLRNVDEVGVRGRTYGSACMVTTGAGGE